MTKRPREDIVAVIIREPPRVSIIGPWLTGVYAYCDTQTAGRLRAVSIAARNWFDCAALRNDISPTIELIARPAWRVSIRMQQLSFVPMATKHLQDHFGYVCGGAYEPDYYYYRMMMAKGCECHRVARIGEQLRSNFRWVDEPLGEDAYVAHTPTVYHQVPTESGLNVIYRAYTHKHSAHIAVVYGIRGVVPGPPGKEMFYDWYVYRGSINRFRADCCRYEDDAVTARTPLLVKYESPERHRKPDEDTQRCLVCGQPRKYDFRAVDTKLMIFDQVYSAEVPCGASRGTRIGGSYFILPLHRYVDASYLPKSATYLDRDESVDAWICRLGRRRDGSSVGFCKNQVSLYRQNVPVEYGGWIPRYRGPRDQLFRIVVKTPTMPA